MSDKILVDTNLWVYLYAKEPLPKYQKIRTLVEKNFNGVIGSTQILGELYNLLTINNLRTQNEAEAIIVEMISTFPIMEIEVATVLKTIEISQLYHYSYWDSAVIATGLLNECDILYSEVIRHNQLIENRLRIINPFL